MIYNFLLIGEKIILQYSICISYSFFAANPKGLSITYNPPDYKETRKNYMLNRLSRTTLAVTSLVAALYSTSGLAADGQITFNGKVVAASCDISAGSEDFTVSMPTVSNSALGTVVDTTAGHTNFNINLENCESQTDTAEMVRVAFSGIADTDNVYVLKNTASGGATGVGLQLFQQDGVTKIDINNGPIKDAEFAIPVKDAGAQSYTLNYVVAYVNTTGTVTTGDVHAIANYSIEYN